MANRLTQPDRLTPKENYLRLARGEDIEYIPTHTFFGKPVNGEVPITPMGPCTMLYRDDYYPGAEKFHDDWGVEYTAVPEANGSFMPSGTHTNDYLIKDLEHWRDYIDTPRLYDGIDWERKAQEDLSKVDRNQTAIVNGSPMMPFQQMMAMMGFMDGLAAMYEEPELFMEVLDYMLDYLQPHMEACLDAYQPDLFYILDDTATQRAPFISLEMYREIIKPYYVRLSEKAHERGIPLIFHNCGKCEMFIEDMIDIGVRYWDPAQSVNDLHKIQATYGKNNNFNIIGGFDWEEPDTWPEVSEEYVREQMRKNIDEYAPGGHFIAAAAIIGPGGDPLTAQVNDWLADESYYYRREWMRKNG